MIIDTLTLVNLNFLWKNKIKSSIIDKEKIFYIQNKNIK